MTPPAASTSPSHAVEVRGVHPHHVLNCLWTLRDVVGMSAQDLFEHGKEVYQRLEEFMDT